MKNKLLLILLETIIVFAIFLLLFSFATAKIATLQEEKSNATASVMPSPMRECIKACGYPLE